MSGLRKNWKPGDKFLVRHKDDHIVVVEKAAGLLTVPTPNKKGESLLGLLRNFIKHPRKRQTLFAVHRLDRVVSGLLVFSRTAQAKEHLIDQFANHTVERIYHACVDGVLPDDRGIFESWFQTDARTLRVYSSGDDTGKHAITHWRVLRRMPKHTLLEVRLETGARNQIRVHFSEAGFPLLGERKYLDVNHQDFSTRQGTNRIFLHATRLGFIHPATKKNIEFDTALPPDLRKWQAKLKTRKQKP